MASLPKPFSTDLRWRVVWLKLFLNKSDIAVATAFWLSPPTVTLNHGGEWLSCPQTPPSNVICKIF